MPQVVSPVEPAVRSPGKGDRLFGAVLRPGKRVLLQFTRHFRDMHDRVSYLVGVEDVGRQRVATSVSDAAISVDNDVSHHATGNVRGSDSTDRRAAV